jgi:hypothetical protein
MALYRCRFTVEDDISDHLHVTADQRYELYLDGRFLGRGSERGDRSHWYYESYALHLKPGAHILVARVWALGSLAPWAQISVDPGFLCTPESPELMGKIATGHARWEVAPVRGITFHDMSASAGTAMGAGPSEVIDGEEFPWGWEEGCAAEWRDARVGHVAYHQSYFLTTRPIHWLRPAQLPDLQRGCWERFRIIDVVANGATSVDEGACLSLLADGVPLSIAPHSRLRVLVGLEDYVCAYPALSWSGGKGTNLALGWAETLRNGQTDVKVRTISSENTHLVGPRDRISLDGGRDRRWRSHWWRCGRFIEIEVATADDALVLESVRLEETRYPLEPESSWEAVDESWADLLRVCLRTLQMCAHETFMDCPYYEQLMYVGDTRLQCLMTYALTRDSRLPRKAIELFDSSRANPSGIVSAAHPSNGGQLIPPFALWWVGVVHDYALWRDDAGFVRERLLGVRAVLDLFEGHLDDDGLLRAPVGWNFLDWTFAKGGVPCLPGERNSGLQLQWILALQHAAALERGAGEPEMAERYELLARNAQEALIAEFWDESRGLLANDSVHTCFTEHAQCLGVLTRSLNDEQQARVWPALAGEEQGLVPVSSYFSYYLFEACLEAGQTELIHRRLAPWHQCLAEGYQTTPETFGETRSDCHAWSAYPLYHYLTGFIGIRPASFGFSSVRISPQIDPYPEMAGELAHPRGSIRARYRMEGDALLAEIELPEGLPGTLSYGGEEIPLRAGWQRYVLKAPRACGVS